MLKVLAERQVELSGLPWQKGTKRKLGFAALTANCLCTAHNSALSPLDATGARFFDAIQRCAGVQSGLKQDILLSGHDVERWMLRTLAAMAESKNFAIDGAHLEPNVSARLRISELLESPSKWKWPLGMYMMEGANYTLAHRETLQFSPLLVRETHDTIGMLTNIQGLQLGLLAAKHDIKGTSLDKAVYRPRSVIFKMAHVTNTIELSWDDGIPHMDFTFMWRAQ